MNILSTRILTIAVFFSSVVFCARGAENGFTIDMRKAVQDAQINELGIDEVIIVLKEDISGFRSLASESPFSAVKEIQPVVYHAERMSVSTSGANSALLSSKNKGVWRSNSRAARNLRNMYVAKITEGRKLSEVLDELNASTLVEYSEPNSIYKIVSAPDDPLFHTEWALNNTGQPYYIDSNYQTETGTPDADIDWLEAFEADILPTNEIVVAVLDTGVDYTHPDITNQMWINNAEMSGFQGVDDDTNGYIDDIYGYNFYGQYGDPKDDHGHGTHCSGTIAAETDNGEGIAGINPHARIMAVKILSSSGSGYLEGIIEGLIYAADNGAKVFNNSWSGGYSSALQDAVDYAAEQGCIVLAAAGNSDSSTPNYPAAYPGVIAVAATDANDEKAWFSSYGTWVDVSAPGTWIASLRAAGTDMYGDGSHTISNNYMVANGTSMSCPHGVGVISLLAAREFGHNPRLYEAVLKASCDTNIYSIPANNDYQGQLGVGRINAFNLLMHSGTVAYIEARLGSKGGMLVPGQITNVLVSAGIWNTPANNMTILATATTAGVTLNRYSYYLGDLPAFAVTNLPDDAFIVTVDENTQRDTVTVRFDLKSGDTILGSTYVNIALYNGNATHIAVEDLDGDGTSEVAAVYTRIAMVYNHEGKLQWFAETWEDMTFLEGISVGDIDGDGYKDLVCPGKPTPFLPYYNNQAMLNVLGHDGQAKPGWPIKDNVDFFGSPVLADVDEDSVLDIVCNVRIDLNPLFNEYEPTSELRAYKGNGSLLWSRKFEKDWRMAPVAAGDLDGDGWPEIVASIYVPNYSESVHVGQGRIVISRRDGTEYNTFDLSDNYYCAGQPSIGDIDNDGDMEIICVAKTSDTTLSSYRVYAWHHDGTVVSTNWPKDMGGGWFVDAPVLADLDDDGDLEIIAGRNKTGINGWHHDGTPITNFPINETDMLPYMVIDDLTGDGGANLLYEGRTDYGEPHEIYARNADGNYVSGWDPKTFPFRGSGGMRDVSLCSMGVNDNRQLAFMSGFKLNIYDTGYSLNELPLSWPTEQHDNRNTACCHFETNPMFKCSFYADHTYGVESYTSTFTTVLWGLRTNNVWYSWDCDGDGSVDSASARPSFFYSAVGDYTVTLITSNDIGEVYTRTRSNYIHVIPPVKADFTAFPINAEAPIMVNFTDLSTNQPHSWRWDFDGDGIIDSFGQNPSHFYQSTGIYTVTLTVSNSFGTAGSSIHTIAKTNYVSLPTLADATVHHVSYDGLHLYPFKNWNEAATNFQQAIDSAEAGHTVIATNGIYYPRYTLVVDKDITVTSLNGPEATIVHAYGFPQRGFELLSSGALLEGLTIRNGRSGTGAGVYCSGATVKNCIITNNSGFGSFVSWGGGVMLFNGGVIENCIIAGNSSTYGGGAYITLDGGTVRNCVVRDNYVYQSGAGVYAWGSSGGGDYIIENCLVTGNEGRYSTVYCEENTFVRNCTIVDNEITEGGGAVQCENGGAIQNTIIYNNAGDSMTNIGIGMSYLHCRVFPDPPPGIDAGGNITNDPLFVDSESGDYHLSQKSPCINAGTNQAWMASAVDLLDGDDRILMDIVDIGMDEVAFVVSVNAAPFLGIPNLEVTFQVSATSTYGVITNYVWNFGDLSVEESGPALTNLLHTYTDEGVFTATVTAFDSAGHNASDSAEITVYTVPIAPSNLTAVAVGIGEIELAWNDYVDNETAFVIERGECTCSFGHFATVSANTTNYTDGGLPNGATYYYRAAALHDYATSPWSNVASARTPLPPTATIVSASPLSGPPDLEVTFIGEGAMGDESVTDYKWNFGNGSAPTNSASLTTIINTYSIEGVYTAVFTVTDSAGYGDDDSVEIEVIPEPMLFWILNFGFLILGRKK